MPDRTPSDPLRDALEALLREPEAEAISAWAGQVEPALRDLLERMVHRDGTASFVWSDLGLPAQWSAVEDPPAAWETVVATWVALREERFAELAPMLGPMAGPLPEEILFEAYPKALAGALHGEDLPLPAWIEFLQALQTARILTEPGKPGLGLWGLNAPAAWFTRQALRELDPALKESIWRVFANVCGAYAEIALEGLTAPTHAASSGRDAVVARLGEARGSLGSAYDYLIARHRPARAKPLLDLLRVLDLEAGGEGSRDKWDHGRRLQDWVRCHPQGEFCPPEQRHDLAKAWLELARLSEGFRAQFDPAIPSVTDTLRHFHDLLLDGDSHLAAELAEVGAHRSLSRTYGGRIELNRAARLLLRDGQSRRAIRCVLKALVSGDFQEAPTLEDVQKDALWDIAEILLDGENDGRSGCLALNVALILLVTGEDALALLERALAATESEPFSGEEFETIVLFLCRHHQQFAGADLVFGVLERLVKAMARRHYDLEELSKATFKLGCFSECEDRALRLRIAILNLHLQLATAPSHSNEFLSNWHRLNVAVDTYFALVHVKETPPGDDSYAPYPEYWLLRDLQHYYAQGRVGEAVADRKYRVSLSEKVRGSFLREGDLFWEIIASVEAVGLLPESVAQEMARQLGWEVAPFREQLRARAEKVREAFLVESG